MRMKLGNDKGSYGDDGLGEGNGEAWAREQMIEK